LLEKSKSEVLKKIAEAVEEYSNSERKGWNITKKNSEAQKLLDSMWDNNKLSITDAKEYILPGLKRWLQNNGFSQFSDLSLAESLEVSEIDNEVKEFIYKLADFAGVRVNKKIG